MLTDGFRSGARYRCEDGTVMTISVERNLRDEPFIRALGTGDIDHLFDMRGETTCPNCLHGPLMHLVGGFQESQ